MKKLLLTLTLLPACMNTNNLHNPAHPACPSKPRRSRKWSKAKSKGITIGLAGDTMLGRIVNEKLKNNDYRSIWGNLLQDLRKNDLNLVNLETTFTKNSKAVPKVFNFKSDPKNVAALIEANIHAVSIANNHILDFGVEGLKETITTLDNASIAHVGAGKNAQQAAKPAVIEKNGIRIGIIGYTDYDHDWAAGPNKPGVNYLRIGDIERVKEDISKIRNDVDFIIATLHWGPNMRQRPPKQFQEFAHQMINAGIDIIHGHSAHIFQGIEWYHKKLILYDTGDFVDDYRIDPELRNDQSFLFNVILSKDGIKDLKLIPLLIGDLQVNKATGKEREEIIEKIKKLSKELGTTLKASDFI